SESVGFDHRAALDGVPCDEDLLGIRRRRPCPSGEQGADADGTDRGSDERGTSPQLRWRREGSRGRTLLVESPVDPGGCTHTHCLSAARHCTSTCASPTAITVDRVRPFSRMVPVWPAPSHVMTQSEVAVTVYFPSGFFELDFS